MIENLGLLLGLGLLIWLALRGVNVIFATLLCAAIVALTNDLPIATSLSKQYASSSLGAFTFAGKFFLLFAAGAMFGRVMGVSGSAATIAMIMTKILGEKRALWIVVLASAILTYGGVVVFVVIFTLYPLGARLCEQANIPKRLLCAAVALGAGTFTMTALPGSPSIQNVIAAQALGTDLYAGASLGLIAAVIMLGFGMWYLESQRIKSIANKEKFISTQQELKSQIENNSLPSLWRSITPLLLVLFIIVLPRIVLAVVDNSPSIPQWVMFAKAQVIVWPSFALLLGSLLSIVLTPENLSKPLNVLGDGVDDSIKPLMNTAAVIGFGAVVTSTSGFSSFVNYFSNTDMPVLISLFSSVNVLSGITGSASGGLQIFLTTFGEHYLNQGVPREILHRIATVASGGIDSLPHSGAVIAMLTIMGLKHKEAYKDIAVVTVVIPVFSAIVLITIASVFYM